MKKRTLAILLAVVLIAALLCGCGRSAAHNAAGSTVSEAAYDFAPMEDAAYEAAYEEGYWAEAPVPVPDPLPPTGNAAETPANNAKLIYTADLDMETTAFEEAVAGLTRLTAEMGGYFESSTVSDQSAYRWAEYTIRVPAASYRAFLDKAGDQCHVLSQKEFTEDVSESYYDTSGRLETQKTKLARLQQLLLEAEDMEDIITIENAISETEERIDRLSGTLRHYDALVDYSTVSVHLREVKVYEPEPDPTFGSRLGSAFVDGLKGFAGGLGDILVALAYSWLWLLLIAVFVVVILRLTRKQRAVRREKREERKVAAVTRKTEKVTYSQPSEEAGEEDRE